MKTTRWRWQRWKNKCSTITGVTLSILSRYIFGSQHRRFLWGATKIITTTHDHYYYYYKVLLLALSSSPPAPAPPQFCINYINDKLQLAVDLNSSLLCALCSSCVFSSADWLASWRVVPTPSECVSPLIVVVDGASINLYSFNRKPIAIGS